MTRRDIYLVNAALLALVVMSGGVTPLNAQDHPVLETLRAMRLDSITGTATAYFRPEHRNRAAELQANMTDYLRYWREQYGHDVRLRIAVLNEENWKSATTLPYAFPHYFAPPVNLVPAPAVPPPAVNADTVLVEGMRDRRDWLLIGHEAGHILTLELLPASVRDSLATPPAAEMSAALQEHLKHLGAVPPWYWEYAANLFMIGFLEAELSEDAAVWKRYFDTLIASATPTYTHLDDWFGEFMRARTDDGRPLFLSPAGRGNFGWYQGVAALLAAHALRHGRERAISQVRSIVTGESSPSTADIVQHLEENAPGARDLLNALGAGYAKRDN